MLGDGPKTVEESLQNITSLKGDDPKAETKLGLFAVKFIFGQYFSPSS
jgi:hypothetical protein